MRTAAAGMAGLAGGQVFGMGTGSAGATGAGGGHGRPGLGVRLVFLSHVNDPATTTLYPGDPEFELEVMTTIPADGYYMQYVREGEHTGSHWGAPAHFQEGGRTADQLDADDLLLPAVKVDVRRQAAADADYGVSVADLRAWERRHGRMPAGAAVVLWTGWEAKWGTDAYANLDADGVIHQPGFLLEAAEWLVERGVLGERGALGSDTFGARPGHRQRLRRLGRALRPAAHQPREHDQPGRPADEGRPRAGGEPINKAGSGAPATIFGLLPS